MTTTPLLTDTHGGAFTDPSFLAWKMPLSTSFCKRGNSSFFLHKYKQPNAILQLELNGACCNSKYQQTNLVCTCTDISGSSAFLKHFRLLLSASLQWQVGQGTKQRCDFDRGALSHCSPTPSFVHCRWEPGSCWSWKCRTFPYWLRRLQKRKANAAKTNSGTAGLHSRYYHRLFFLYFLIIFFRLILHMFSGSVLPLLPPAYPISPHHFLEKKSKTDSSLLESLPYV